MINPASEIRKGLKTLLGSVTYNAASVPIYESEGAFVPYQIIIGDMQYTDESDKHSFYGRVRQEIEVVTEMEGRSVTKHADAIASSVLNLIKPTPRTTGLTVTGFQVIGLTKNIRPALKENSGDGSKIVRRILELNFFINQVTI